MRKCFIIALLFLSLTFSGCGYTVTLPQNTSVSQTAEITVNQEIVDRIKKVSANILPEDKVILYKVCIGFTHLVDNVITDTQIEAFDQLKKVERMYRFSELKYPAFDNEVYKILTETVETAPQSFIDKNGHPIITSDIFRADGVVKLKYATVNYKMPQRIIDCKDNLKLIFTSIAEGVK